MAKRSSLKGKGLDAYFQTSDDQSPPVTSSPQPKAATSKQPAVKATYYLPEYIIDRLEDTWVSLKRELNTRSLRKSHLVEAALDLVLTDFSSEGQDSPLFKKLSCTRE